MDINQLNIDFGIAGQLKFVVGEGGLPFIDISNQSATALVSIYGGQILSFRPLAADADLLFLSSKSSYEVGKAIRGGIPVCWPWFGPDPKGLQRPNHGFVRNYLWTVLKTESTDIETKVTLQFLERNKIETTWKKPFVLILEVTVGEALTLTLTTRNIGDKTFSITQAFHSYFQVGDIDRVQVLGLEGTSYFDKLDQGKHKIQKDKMIFAEEVDRIYTEVKSDLIINDPALNRKIQIASPGNETVVVWNPWLDTAQKIIDLKKHEYKQFVCVETGNIAFDLIEIPPDGEHSLSTNFKILPN